MEVIAAIRKGTLIAQATCDMQLNRRTLLDALMPALDVSCHPTSEDILATFYPPLK